MQRQNAVSNTSASGTEEWPTNHTDAQLQHNYNLAPWLGGNLSGNWPIEAPADAAVACERAVLVTATLTGWFTIRKPRTQASPR